MSNFDVRAMNLNLLPALEALLVEGSVGAAARRLHVSQSAMSHSLAKLRAVFGDPLLVPEGRGLVPTPRAVQLLARVPRALDGLAQAVTEPEPFDPKSAQRTFRLATVDYFELTMLPHVLSYLAANAPGIGLEIERVTPKAVASLASGDIDLALLGASFPGAPAGLRKMTLYRDPFAVIARSDHPAIGRKLDLATYVALGHVLVSIEGRRDGVVDRALAKLGKTRRVVLRVPHFVSAPLAVLSSDCICTIARSVAHRARELFGLRVMAPPLALEAAEVVALWPRRHDGDPARRWFRKLFVAGHAAPPNIRALMRRERSGKRAGSPP
ncbi:LysR family transcriptional regulator [Pendulispora albinea]|uniref:LysR family transcriptional regulator n=1 Tax=Pendulispora albinea TaxID=2741071 RepID=A0ABZ2MAX5_9BACT